MLRVRRAVILCLSDDGMGIRRKLWCRRMVAGRPLPQIAYYVDYEQEDAHVLSTHPTESHACRVTYVPSHCSIPHLWLVSSSNVVHSRVSQQKAAHIRIEVMGDLNCYITTFNCGRKPVNIDFFAHHLLNGLVKNSAPPDLIVLCLQEIAPIGYSFLGGSFLTPYFLAFTQAVSLATSQRFGREPNYGRILVRNVGMTGIMVFARHNIEESIRWIETGGVGVGLWGMGNKGAVGVRIGLGSGLSSSEEDAVPLTFVAAHLAPMEDACERRNQDWRSICEGLVFTGEQTGGNGKTLMDGGDEAEPLLSSATDDTLNGEHEVHGIFSPASSVFFAGDLNYRTSDQKPAEGDHEKWPQPNKTDAINQLRAKDQLTRELHDKRTLHLLTETEIKFPPTYKYSNAAQKEALRKAASLPLPSELARHERSEDDHDDNAEDDVWLWAKHRVPSWCDRVLYLAQSAPKVHSYIALPVQPTSDHRPVALSCSVSLKAPDNIKPPFAISKDWQAQRAAARRYEVIVGVASYLALTWEGEALLAGTIIGIVGGYIALRALLGIWT